MAVGGPRNCGDDTIAIAGGNRSRVLSLMSALRVNYGTASGADRAVGRPRMTGACDNVLRSH